MKIYTPTTARKDIYNIIKKVVEYSEPVEIINTKNGEENVIVISKGDYNALQETIYLINNNIDKVIEEREHEDTVKLEDIDWNTL